MDCEWEEECCRKVLSGPQGDIGFQGRLVHGPQGPIGFESDVVIIGNQGSQGFEGFMTFGPQGLAGIQGPLSTIRYWSSRMERDARFTVGCWSTRTARPFRIPRNRKFWSIRSTRPECNIHGECDIFARISCTRSIIRLDFVCPKRTDRSWNVCFFF